ncbi:PEP-CTERM sorting domain-containing protein [Aliinostoc sp. HNIBRCY26]|uniref:PEP-CTERM sorting domain-containing protein n=1 Tax=Aliinostoc sp. HNIBRCY26 TaxID=3418997 RepID=UPI003D04568A
MILKKLVCATVISASAIASLAGSAHALVAPSSPVNLIVNGSFEDTTLAGTNQAQLTGDNKTWKTYDRINGWSATPNGKIEVQRGGVAGSPYQGSNLVELDSHGYTANNFSQQNPLGIYQDVATVAGKTYTLSFAYSARPDTKAVDNVFDVLVRDAANLGNNIFRDTVSAGDGAKTTVWSIFTKTFTATSQLSRVQFNYTGPLNTLGAYIDDVKLVSVSKVDVPEPSAIAGIVVVGLGLVTFKKRNALKKSLSMGN